MLLFTRTITVTVTVSKVFILRFLLKDRCDMMLLISNSGLENWEFSTAWSISVWDGIPVAPQPLHFLLYRHFRANTVLEFGQEFSEILVYTLYRASACNVLSVYPNVCPFVKCVDCDKTKESFAYILIPYERPIILVFWQEEWLVGATLLPEIVGQTDPIRVKMLIFNPIFTRSTSAIISSKKV